VLVSYRRFALPRSVLTVPERHEFAAFVVRRDGTLARVDLGGAAPIEDAIELWRAAIGLDGATNGADQRAAGEALRKLVFDPVARVAGRARRWIVVPDDVLSLVAFDALPLDDGLVADALAVEVRLGAIDVLQPNVPEPAPCALLALGGIDYDSDAPDASDGADARAAGAMPATASMLRSGLRPERFAPLAASLDEVRQVAALYRTADDGPTAPLVLSGSRATKDAFVRAAEDAAIVHVASHGYVAPGAAAELAQPGALDEFTREVRGLSPRVLCGLALAGANLPGDPVQRSRGTMTAEELAHVDLSRCRLAVLSACETSVGVRRAGIGVASLQSALHVAGARSTLTSLWKVPDAATCELMVLFHTALRRDGLTPAKALAQAKLALRQRRAPLAEWAGWVLTGPGD
jgi:hypothetical protein